MDSPEQQPDRPHSHTAGNLKGHVTVSAFLKTPSAGTPFFQYLLRFASPSPPSGSYFEPHLSAALHKVLMKPTSDLEFVRVMWDWRGKL